jgi:hypothetical protein
MGQDTRIIEQMLRETGVTIEKLGGQVYGQLVIDLTKRLNDLINYRLIEALSDADTAALSVLTKKKSVDARQVAAFIDARVPNKQEIVNKAVAEFKNRYIKPR